MGSLEFHEEKIKEILEAYKSSDSLFIKGVCLFYFAVHSIDWVLSKRGVSPSTHRGRKKLITEHLDEYSYSKFDQLLTASVRIRYTEIASQKLIEEMKENLKELINHLQKNHNLESSLANLIIGNLDCLKNSQEKD